MNKTTPTSEAPKTKKKELTPICTQFKTDKKRVEIMTKKVRNPFLALGLFLLDWNKQQGLNEHRAAESITVTMI